MKRILLLTDDFNEMTFLETLLKKLGFDTLGIQNPAQAQEKALAMNPEMLVLSDVIKGHSTHQVLESLVEYRPNMLVILMKSDVRAQTHHIPEFINKIVKSPIDPVDFIEAVCSVAKLNQEQYLEKFYKLGLFKGVSGGGDPITVTGKVKTAPDTQYVRGLKNLDKPNAERKKRFAEQVKNISEPKADKVDHKTAVKEAQEYRQRSNDTEIKKIDEQRKDFVRALFKK